MSHIITATITIVETQEVTNAQFNDVDEMFMALELNMIMAELVYGRLLAFGAPDIRGDDLKLTAYFTDNQQSYMTLEAKRHIAQTSNSSLH